MCYAKIRLKDNVFADIIINVKEKDKFRGNIMAELSIYKGLLSHREKGLSSFHTPGHKCSDILPQELFRLDFTELPDTDSLYEADGIIRNTEKRLERLFGTKRTLISSGGCTLAIQTMLTLAARHGKKILFARNIHRSAVNTCVLTGLEPVWIIPQSDSAFFTGRITAEDADRAFSENTDAAALYVTSPDYYGEISDIKGLAEVCHKYGKFLLVDNAHGSHLAFGSENLHPIALGADMSACSLHKTLPVLTGGAVLNIADEKCAEYAKQTMALFGSTSPSYVVMASIDICCDYLESRSNEYSMLEERVEKIKSLAAERGLVMPSELCDPLRVCINTSCAGISSDGQTEYFHSFNIEPEFCDGDNAVFICTPFNSEKDFERLESAVGSLCGNSRNRMPEKIFLPERVMMPGEAVFSKTKRVAVRNSYGLVSAESACPCPPGVPVVMPGERIDENVIESLCRYGICDILCCADT